jgi:uncharacterized membrane protein
MPPSDMQCMFRAACLRSLGPLFWLALLAFISIEYLIMIILNSLGTRRIPPCQYDSSQNSVFTRKNRPLFALVQSSAFVWRKSNLKLQVLT